LDFLTLEDAIDTLSRNVGKKLSTIQCVISQKSADRTQLIDDLKREYVYETGSVQ
jgi:hypothetical protein